MGDLKKNISDWETIKHTETQTELKPTLNKLHYDTDKITICPLSDTHIGSRFFNEDILKENLEWCLENEVPLILGGDMIETATKTSVGAGVYEQNEIIEKQLDHFYHLFQPLADEGLIVGLHPGNHELRIYDTSGINLSKIMAKQLGVKYLGWGKLHDIRVGKQNYSLYTTHGASGARMPHTKIKGVIDLANMVNADIYAMGHLHQLSHHTRNFYEINRRNKTIDTKQKHFLLTGHYMNHWGSYGHIKGYEPSQPGSPKIKLHGNKNLIRVSL